MKALVWNCRGAGSPLTVLQLKEIVNLHSPEVICLAETKNRKCFMNTVRMKLRYDKLFVVDPVGRSGGLAVMWKKELAVSRVLSTVFLIEM